MLLQLNFRRLICTQPWQPNSPTHQNNIRNTRTVSQTYNKPSGLIPRRCKVTPAQPEEDVDREDPKHLQDLIQYRLIENNSVFQTPQKPYNPKIKVQSQILHSELDCACSATISRYCLYMHTAGRTFGLQFPKGPRTQ